MPDTPAPSLGEALAAIRSRCESASPPPWQWNVNRVGQEVLLYSEPGGRNIVMDFVRLGMSRAQPRFRVDGVMETAVDLATEVAGQEHNAAHLKDLTHPDAAFIAHAPEDIRFLLAAIARLEAERDEAHARGRAEGIAEERERAAKIVENSATAQLAAAAIRAGDKEGG